MLKKFLTNEDGTTAIEYALIGTLVGIAIIGALSAVGSSTTLTLGNITEFL